MIRAILRPETAEGVADLLASAGFVSMTQNPCIRAWEAEGPHCWNDSL